MNSRYLGGSPLDVARGVLSHVEGRCRSLPFLAARRCLSPRAVTRTTLFVLAAASIYTLESRQGFAFQAARGTGRPDPTLKIEQVREASGSGRRLVVRKNGRELGGLAVPATVSTGAVPEGLHAIAWHPNGVDFACGFTGSSGSFVVVFLAQADGRYRAVDVSNVEPVNIGALGPFRKYKDVRSRPIDWIERPDDSVQIRLRTDAWDLDGRHYRMHEPLIITRTGEPLWR